MGSTLPVDLTPASHRSGGPGGTPSSLRTAADAPTTAGDLTPARDPRSPRLIEHLALAVSGPAGGELAPAVAEIPSQQPTTEAQPPAEARSPPPAEGGSAPAAHSRSRSGWPREFYLLLAAVTLAGIIGALYRVGTRSVSPLHTAPASVHKSLQ